ncbi:MAG: ExbD/TolR family protein [Caldimicrobium sp.]
MEFERKQFKHIPINIAPLVDVVFLLLLFFMLTSHLIQEPVIKLKLPESKTSTADEGTTKTIYITKEGDIYFMNTKVNLSELQSLLKERLSDKEQELIRIKADRESNVGILISVIDEVRLAGVKHYSIVTEKK